MVILPVRLITEIEQPIFGANLFNLAKLERSGSPVLPGVALAEPDLVVNTVLKHVSTPDKETFEQKFTLILAEIIKIPLPEILDKELSAKKDLYFNGQVFKNKKQLWLKVLEFWVNEIRQKIWRQGFQQGIASGLTPICVFFCEGKFFPIKAYFDPDLREVIIQGEQRLTPAVLKEIDNLVTVANKKLFIPQIYKFLISGSKVFLTSLYPFTQILPVSRELDIIIPKDKQKRLIKSSVKLFLNLSSGFTIEPNADGIIIDGEKIASFDESVFKLAEAAITFPGKPVIYKLPNLQKEDISGALRLLNQQSLLNQALEIFLFVKNKKNLQNVELAIPLTRSVDEFKTMKKELKNSGIFMEDNRIWLEIAVPENVLNLESYLEEGAGGVILNLDSLQQLLTGYQNSEGEFYKRQIEALINFVRPVFKAAHKRSVPVLIKGESALHADILDLIVEQGGWGVVVNNISEVENLPEYLSWSERRSLEKRFS
jgi:hypothetical protein